MNRENTITKKKVRTWKVVITILFLCMAAVMNDKMPAGTVQAAKSGNYEYGINADGKTVTIYKYTGSDTTLAIPSTLSGKKVTSIGGGGGGAFSGCSSLTSITIPKGVTSIGGSSFEGCSSLTSITIPSSVKSIGSYAFDGTPWLTTKQTENPVVVVNHILIDGRLCSGDVTVPKGVTSIVPAAFISSHLTSITIPSSVKSIGSHAFAFCGSLTSITIPKGVTSIGEFTFNSCSSLTSITIPSSVTSIGWGAFCECTKLKKITIPAKVKTIDGYVFSGCKNLKTITIKTTKLTGKTVGSDAFKGIHPKAIIKVPKSKLASYKKILKARGVGSKVKIKK